MGFYWARLCVTGFYLVSLGLSTMKKEKMGNAPNAPVLHRVVTVRVSLLIYFFFGGFSLFLIHLFCFWRHSLQRDHQPWKR